jgi:hypothetical protein
MRFDGARHPPGAVRSFAPTEDDAREVNTVPVCKLTDLPQGGGGRWPLCGAGFRSVKWGDLEVGYTTTAGPTNASPTYAGLPGGVCMCPHYGYVFKGRIRCVYPGTAWPDEVAGPGDVYFFRAGHHLIYEEATDALEMNPADALQVLMDHVEAYARRQVEVAKAAKAET